MKNSNYSVHIFGAPIDAQGFNHQTITQNDVLKKEYAKYLDDFNPNTMREGYTYLIKNKKVGNDKITFLSILRQLDIVNNRGGAYIGIAVVINGDISLNDSILYYQILSEVNGHLSAYIVNNKLADGFTIENYIYPIDKVLDATYLLDMLSKSSSEESLIGKLETITYNTKNHIDTVYKDQTFDTKPFKEEFEDKYKIAEEKFERAKTDILAKQKEAEKQRDEANRKLKSEIKNHKSAEDSRQALATELTKYKSSYTSLVNKLELTEKSKNQAVSDLKEANNKIAINAVAGQVTATTEGAIDFNDLSEYVTENNKLKTELATFKKKEEDTRLKYLDEKVTKKKELLDAYTKDSESNKKYSMDNTQNENQYHKDLKNLNKKYTLLNNVHLKYLEDLEDLEDATELVDKEKIKTEYNAKIQEITDGKTKEAFSLDLDSVVAILLAVIIFISMGFLFLKMDDIEQRMSDTNQTITEQNNNKTDFIASDVSWNDKNISSSYYKKDNVFRKNTDMWFVYGRILETDQKNIEKVKIAFDNTKNLNKNVAKANNKKIYPENWKEFLQIDKVTLKNKIKAGMIVITTCTENGTVGFIEKVSKNEYNLSTYSHEIYSIKPYSINEKIDGCPPKFYDLGLKVN